MTNWTVLESAEDIKKFFNKCVSVLPNVEVELMIELRNTKDRLESLSPAHEDWHYESGYADATAMALWILQGRPE